MARLFILDLDHTLIYGSYAEKESAELLFQHNPFLKVYKRPMAEELIRICQSKGDIIVYTTALRKYAKTICDKLAISPIALLSRKNCKIIHGKHKKAVKPDWVANYQDIIIIDDSPNVWLSDADNLTFLVPVEFRGQAADIGLKTIINQLKRY